MPQVSLFRLYALRAVYMIIAAGLVPVVWPGMVHHAAQWGWSLGVVKCMLPWKYFYANYIRKAGDRWRAF